MALAVTIQIDFKDAKNKSSNTKIRVPTGFSIAQYGEFAVGMCQLVANINTGRIVGCSINFALDLAPAALTNVVNALADIGSKAFLQLNSAIAGFRAKFKIPTFDEDNLVAAGTDTIDTSNAAVLTLLTGLTSGYAITGGNMSPTDKYGNDLTTLSFARENFMASA